MQTTKPKGLHAAIIMDGNGRWAELRGRPRVEGHRAGAAAVRRTVEAAPGLGIGTLTLYAFSTENWKRPPHEVNALMRLFRNHLLSETPECVEKGIRIRVVGRRDRLDPSLVAAIAEAEKATASGSKLYMRLAVDYSAQDAMLRAAAKLRPGPRLNRDDFARAIAEVIHDAPGTPEIDLLIRTGGELRLSDLFGWDSGYAELVFSDTMWPDFDGNDLRAAVEEFRGRKRRFGALPQEDARQIEAARRNGV
ncbi:MAG: polyprenyl diphosphate synthase [Bryobacterales bacterium]